MCQTLQRCTIFHFGHSKIFVPFIRSGNNLHQFLTAYSLLPKRIRLFTPNFALNFFAHISDQNETIFLHQSNCRNDKFWPIIARSEIFKFCTFLHELYTISGDFCSILCHTSNPLSFQCSQPLYIPSLIYTTAF